MSRVTHNGMPVAGRLPVFIRPLRNAVRDGRKTMTRRVIIPQPGASDSIVVVNGSVQYPHLAESWKHGRIGEIRVMPEPMTRQHGVAFFADDLVIAGPDFADPIAWKWKVPYLSNRYMPTAAGRVFARIESITAEALQAISPHDAIAEGIISCADGFSVPSEDPKIADLRFSDPVSAFRFLWDSINAERGHGWDQNPVVRAITFRLV